MVALLIMLQNDLDAFAAWSKLWQLNIAIDKTFVMHIDKHNPIHVYTVNSKAISVINVIKDLGVYIVKIWGGVGAIIVCNSL